MVQVGAVLELWLGVDGRHHLCSLLQRWLRPRHCFLPSHAHTVVCRASPPAPQVCSRATMDLLTRERLPELTTETR